MQINKKGSSSMSTAAASVTLKGLKLERLLTNASEITTGGTAALHTVMLALNSFPGEVDEGTCVSVAQGMELTLRCFFSLSDVQRCVKQTVESLSAVLDALRTIVARNDVFKYLLVRRGVFEGLGQLLTYNNDHLRSEGVQVLTDLLMRGNDVAHVREVGHWQTFHALGMATAKRTLLNEVEIQLVLEALTHSLVLACDSPAVLGAVHKQLRSSGVIARATAFVAGHNVTLAHSAEAFLRVFEEGKAVAVLPITPPQSPSPPPTQKCTVASTLPRSPTKLSTARADSTRAALERDEKIEADLEQRASLPSRTSDSPGAVRPLSPGKVRSESPGKVRPESPGKVRSESPGKVRSESPGKVRPESFGKTRSKSPSGRCVSPVHTRKSEGVELMNRKRRLELEAAEKYEAEKRVKTRSTGGRAVPTAGATKAAQPATGGVSGATSLRSSIRGSVGGQSPSKRACK